MRKEKREKAPYQSLHGVGSKSYSRPEGGNGPFPARRHSTWSAHAPDDLQE